MKELVEEFAALERRIASEKGRFDLFALFLREESPGKWDLLVAAPWLERGDKKALDYIADQVQAALQPEDLLRLSRIVIIDEDNPALEDVQRSVSTKHGPAEVQNRTLFGLQIERAYVITSRRPDAAVA